MRVRVPVFAAEEENVSWTKQVRSDIAAPRRGAGVVPHVDQNCAQLFSLADGAADVRVMRTPAGRHGGANRTGGGPCTPVVAAPVPGPDSAPLPRPLSLLSSPSGGDGSHHDVTRSALRASTGSGRGLPAHSHQYLSAREAGQGGEIN